MTAARRRPDRFCLVARAPVRADLAGGTLDLWPLGLLEPGGATVAVAVSLEVEVSVGPGPRPGVARLVSRDLELRLDRRLDAPSPRRGPLELLERLARELAPPAGVELVSRSPVRAGSGLGTSSALGIAAAAALLRARGERPRRERLVALVRDVEAQVLGIPTGTQDHEAAARGGVVVMEHAAGGARVERWAGGLLRALAERLLLVDSGAARSSGPSNWDMFRRRIDGDEAARRAFARVARAGARARDALVAEDWRALGRAMRADLAARREWSPLVLTPALEQVFAAAAGAGAQGARVCGAGGGGYAVVLAPPGRRGRVAAAIAEAGGRPVAARPVARGLAVRSRPAP
jgi:D-glycero-alpha-D-manno-heptose-7-phosphate kinase